MSTVRITPTRCTFVDSSTPTTNYNGWVPSGGSYVSVRVGTGDAGQDRRALMTFSVVGSVPAGTQITSAKVRLYSYSLSGYTYNSSISLSAYRIDSTWNVNTINYNTAMSLNYTAISGATTTNSGYSKYYEIDVTDYVQEIIDTHSAINNGLLICESTSVNKTTKLFYANNNSYPLQLVITYGETYTVSSRKGNNHVSSISLSKSTAAPGDSITATMSLVGKTGYMVTPQYWTRDDIAGTLSPLSTKYTFSMPSNDVTVVAYGQAIPNTYGIAFNGNDADSGSMQNIALTYDTPRQLPKNTFVRDGYTFLGWSTNPLDSTPMYSDEDTVLNLTALPAFIITLYAIWGAEQYTLTVNCDTHGDANTVVISGTPTEGAQMSVSISGIDAGYKVSKWVLNGVDIGAGTFDGTKYSVSFTMPPQNSVLNIVTGGQTYQLTLDFNGGTLDGQQSKTVNVVYGTPISSAFLLPTKSGYMLSGYTYNDVLVPFGSQDVLYTTVGNDTATASWVSQGRVWTYNSAKGQYESGLRHIYKNDEWTETSL